MLFNFLESFVGGTPVFRLCGENSGVGLFPVDVEFTQLVDNSGQTLLNFGPFTDDFDEQSEHRQHENADPRQYALIDSHAKSCDTNPLTLAPVEVPMP